MKTPLSAHGQTIKVSRRALLKTASAAAASIALAPASKAMPSEAVIEYGTGPGETELNEKNIFPLLAAWLLITTSGKPNSVDEGIIACVANVGPNTAKAVWKAYKDHSGKFDVVRDAFGTLAASYSSSTGRYHGGECPDDVNTLRPVAALLGTPTSGDCKRKTNPSSKKK